jgi:hypothetical protein
MPGLKNLGCADKPRQEIAETRKPNEPGDLLGILARKIFAWKIS